MNAANSFPKNSNLIQLSPAHRPIAPVFCRGCERYLSAGAAAVEVWWGFGCALRAAARLRGLSPGSSGSASVSVHVLLMVKWPEKAVSDSSRGLVQLSFLVQVERAACVTFPLYAVKVTHWTGAVSENLSLVQIQTRRLAQ